MMQPRIFNGNYAYRLENNLLTQDEAMQQFKFAFPKSTSESSVLEVGLIISPHCQSNSIQKLINELKHTMSPNKLTMFYNIPTDRQPRSIDYNKRFIEEQNLTFYDLSEDFFQKQLPIPETNIAEKTQARVTALSCILIFSNNHDELQTICNRINSIAEPNPTPLLFLGKTLFNSNVDANRIDANIVDVMSYSHVYSDKLAASWWQDFRNSLNQLIFLAHAPQQTNEVEKKEENKPRCNIM